MEKITYSVHVYMFVCVFSEEKLKMIAMEIWMTESGAKSSLEEVSMIPCLVQADLCLYLPRYDTCTCNIIIIHRIVVDGGTCSYSQSVLF